MRFIPCGKHACQRADRLVLAHGDGTRQFGFSFSHRPAGGGLELNLVESTRMAR
jgi:hypothetical protein